jgi:CheY-like chemotaxis protein
MMERQVHQLTRLIDDLLDVSRMTHGMLMVKRQMLDLNALVRATAEDRRGVVEHAGMQFHVELPTKPVWIAGDPTRLAQIVNNLLDNAVKFRNGGDSVTVRLMVAEDRGQAWIEVSDRGIGIGKELFPRLFDAFGQADQSLARSHGGLGLGLSVVKGLVELHGGEVHAASGGPGQGAVFTIKLPMKREQKVLAERSSGQAGPAAVPLRILIVEDNRDGADSLRMLLELLGHEIKVAYNGIEGVRLAKEWRPEVVLCDIGLPGLDGYGVARELRADPATRGTALIAVTGYGQEDDRRRARQAGFDYHLTKPVNPGDLQSLLVRPA